MIHGSACDACGDPLVLDDTYAVDDGLVEGELQRWRCGACGDTIEAVLPVDDGSIVRVA